MARGGNPTVIFDSKRQNVVLHFNRGKKPSLTSWTYATWCLIWAELHFKVLNTRKQGLETAQTVLK